MLHQLRRIACQPVLFRPALRIGGHLLDTITLVMLPLPSRRSHTCRHDTVLVWSQTLPFWL
jgi:hypothetical protein